MHSHRTICVHDSYSDIAGKKQFYSKSKATKPKTDRHKPHSPQSYHLSVFKVSIDTFPKNKIIHERCTAPQMIPDRK